MGAPGIILTSAFTVPTAAPFAGYTGYMTRANALATKPDRTAQEEIELSLINSRLFETSALELHADDKGSNDKIRKEASELLKTEHEQIDKYLGYMTRVKALLKEPNRDDKEEQELVRVSKAMNELGIKDTDEKHYYGTFTQDDHNLNERGVQNVRSAFARGQQHGAVLYEDVVSFDTAFLEQLGIYDAKTDSLEEEPLVRAGRDMMDSLQDNEGLKNLTWMASFHRNTKHIHIHFAAVEQVNTRPLIEVESEDGTGTLEAKGQRKQSTIDSMKATFANALVDRVAERERVGKLRDGLIKDVREMLPGKNDLADKIYNFYQHLPDDRRKWNYAMIHGKQKEELDGIVNDFMSDNPRYQEYQEAVQKSAAIDQNIFGHSKRESKDYARNQLADVNKRLGNQVLNYFKNLDRTEAAGYGLVHDGAIEDRFSYDFVKTIADNIKAKQRGQPGGSMGTASSGSNSEDDVRKRLRREEQQRQIRREENVKALHIRGSIKHDLYTIKKSLSNYMDEDRYSAMREYEQAQRQAERER